MRPCATDYDAERLGAELAELASSHNPAELARLDNPVMVPVTDERPVDLGGELTGGAFYTPTGVEATSAPPPAPEAAKLPQRPAMHPHGKAIRLLRTWYDFPLQLGAHGDVERVNSRSTAMQAPVEVRGSTVRAAPDYPDPSWSEVHGG